MNSTLLNLYVKYQSLMNREEGQDLVEYALVVGLISVGLFAILGSASSVLNNIFSEIVSDLSKA